jgi:hypothetical protein
MAGLAPAIQAASPNGKTASMPVSKMDGRVKPGHDGLVL